MTARFVFGVDLDGVVAAYTAGFAEVVAALRGIDPASLPEERSYDFREWGPRPGRVRAIPRLPRSPSTGSWRSCPAIEGAAEALWRLSDAGVWIRVITHRLYVNWGHAEAGPPTPCCGWTPRASPIATSAFWGTSPRWRPTATWTTLPTTIAALRAGGNDVIVFDQPYNRDEADPRARTWKEVEQLVMDRFTTWRGTAGVAAAAPRHRRRQGPPGRATVSRNRFPRARIGGERIAVSGGVARSCSLRSRAARATASLTGRGSRTASRLRRRGSRTARRHGARLRH